MTTFGWSYKEGERPDSSAPAPAPLAVPVPGSDSEYRAPVRKSKRRYAGNEQGEKRPRTSIACRLFVGGLPFECSEQQLGEYFEVFGEVVDVKIVRDHETGSSRGFGFVAMSDADIADTRAQATCRSCFTAKGHRRHQTTTARS
eukprot:m.193700 g.193700  ORF g.193700 m.193700 type:complete len:144 (+) comp18297_c0_seq1:68-499(+)